MSVMTAFVSWLVAFSEQKAQGMLPLYPSKSKLDFDPLFGIVEVKTLSLHSQ